MKLNILFVLILSPLFLKANTKLTKDIVINIRNFDSNFIGQPIKVEYFKEYSTYGNWPITKNYDVVASDIDSPLKLSFSNGSGYIRFTLPDTYGKPFNGNTIYVENGDDVQMNIKNGQVRFDGAQSAGYNCQIEMYNIPFTTRNYGHRGKIDSSYLTIFMDDYSTFEKKRLDVLSRYKSTLSKNKFDIILTNIEYETELSCINMIKAAIDISESNNEKDCCYRFLKRYILKKKDGISQDALLSSNSYFDYLLLREVSILDLCIHKNGNINKFKSLFENITRNYQGTIKDRLITSTILGYISFRDSTDYFRKKALNIVKDSFCISVLKLNEKTFSIGMPAFDFELMDTSGRYVKLRDYRGKIVILDFFFNGCHGCVKLAKGMEEVISRFKNNPNLAFISISIDKKMEVFKEAVRSGKYTNKNSVNLYTNGLGENHELIEHYSIQGYPYLMIIDTSGKIVDSNPPYPSFGEGFTEKFIDVIDNELVKLMNRRS